MWCASPSSGGVAIDRPPIGRRPSRRRRRHAGRHGCALRQSPRGWRRLRPIDSALRARQRPRPAIDRRPETPQVATRWPAAGLGRSSPHCRYAGQPRRRFPAHLAQQHNGAVSASKRRSTSPASGQPASSPNNASNSSARARRFCSSASRVAASQAGVVLVRPARPGWRRRRPAASVGARWRARRACRDALAGHAGPYR